MSPSYGFRKTTTVDFFINRGLQAAGINPAQAESWKYESAIDHLNLVLSEALNRGLNLWSVKKGMQFLIPNQNAYALEEGVVDILEMTIGSLQPINAKQGGVADGMAIASGQPDTAPLVFNGDLLSPGSVQDSANGYIGFVYTKSDGVPVPYAVDFVTICSLETREYTLNIEYTNDPLEKIVSGTALWLIALETPKQTYYESSIFDWNQPPPQQGAASSSTGVPSNKNGQFLSGTSFVIPTAISARGWRIREVGGSELSIRQIYFTQTLNERMIGSMSRDDYAGLSQKMQLGSPSSFYYNKDSEPNVYLWPTPGAGFQQSQVSPYSNTNMFYNYSRQYQYIRGYSELINLPQRFFPFLVKKLACELSLDFNPEKYATLAQAAEISWTYASIEDTETVTINFSPNIGV